jgi:CheY-like chemotaxis protein
VVIFDAEPASRNALSFGFEREEFEVLATDSPDHALDIVRAARAPVLIVSVGTDPEARASALSFVGSLRDEDRADVAVVAIGRRELREDLLRAGADEFVAWPAFIRDAVTLARLAVAARSEDGGGLVGLLEDYEVYFLVRALAAASRSAIVDLERAGAKAHIHFVRGELVSARVGRLAGVPAIHHLLLWGEASLRLRFVSPPGERMVEGSVEDLLQTGVRYVEEFEKLAARVGGPQATFEKNEARFSDTTVKVPTEVRAFAETVVRGASLVDLVGVSPFKPFDTIKVCYRLCELGLITRRDPVRSISPLTAQLAVRDWLLGTGAPQPRSTVTEAGRRAAEAYAEAAQRRAQAPAEDLFVQAPLVRAAMTPAPTPSPTPTKAKAGAPARNKKRVDAKKEAPHYEGAKPAAPKAQSKLPHPVDETAPHKEPVFDDLDEAFFASESELHKVEAVDDFRDLDETAKRRLSRKRSWRSSDNKPTKK